MDPNEKPIIVDPSKINAQVGTGIRDLVVIIGVVSAVLGFVRTGDLNGLLSYIQAPEFLAAAGIVAVAAVTGYRQWRARRDTKALVKIADAAPDTVAKVEPK